MRTAIVLSESELLTAYLSDVAGTSAPVGFVHGTVMFQESYSFIGKQKDYQRTPGGNMTREQQDTINAMTQYELCALWRYAVAGHPLLQGDTGDYFAQRLKEMGGFTAAISKELGWAANKEIRF